MEFIKDLIERIKTFILESSKLVKALLIILCTLLLSSIIILLVTLPKCSIKKHRKANPIAEEELKVNQEEFFKPKELKLTDDYYYLNEKKLLWNEEDINEYFTLPTEENIKPLSEANEKTIDEILGVAP